MAQDARRKTMLRGSKLVWSLKKRMVMQKTYEDAIEVVKGCAGDESTKSHIIVLLSSRLLKKLNDYKATKQALDKEQTP